MINKIIKDLKKEIEEYEKRNRVGYWNEKIHDRKAKLQAYEDAQRIICEEIDKTYKDLDMGKTIPIFIQRLKEKFQGEEE